MLIIFHALHAYLRSSKLRRNTLKRRLIIICLHSKDIFRLCWNKFNPRYDMISIEDGSIHYLGGWNRDSLHGVVFVLSHNVSKFLKIVIFWGNRAW